MLSSLNVRNFRCFRELHLGGFEQFNVIVGESGSGKTALLESIFLVSGASPEIWMRMRQWRGMGPSIRMSGTKTSFESLFRDLFFNFQKDKGATIEIIDTHSGRRLLTVNYAGRGTYKLPVRGDAIENAFMIEPLVFSWHLGKGRNIKSKVSIENGSLKFEGGTEVYPVWLSSPAVNESGVVAQMFSELSLRNESDIVVEAIRSIFPSVESMALESIVGELTLCVSLEGVKQKLPIGAISSGMTRFMSVMIAIASNSGGVVLIDEIENGFYYAHLPKLIGRICSFCEERKVQLFASTHSYEFLQALSPTMRAREDTEHEFALLRSERRGAECVMTVVHNPAAAIENQFEVR